MALSEPQTLEQARADLPKSAIELPATFTNTSNVMAGPGFVRMAFGEAIIPGSPQFHVAVFMPMSDAKALAESILKLVQKIENPTSAS